MKAIIDSVANHPLIATRPKVKQFMKFGMVGALNTLLDYGLYTIFVTFLDIHYLVANVLSFSVAVTNSFALNRKWTFRQQGTNWRHEGLKYLAVYCTGLAIGEGFLFILVDRWHLHELIAKALVVAAVLFWNYVGIRFWAFRQLPTDLPG